MPTTEIVATFIAGKGVALSPAFLEKITKPSMRGEWLKKDKAADIFATGISPDDWCSELRAIIGAAPIDVIVQHAANRRKKLLAADMESTIIEQELLDELAGEIGARDQVAVITKRAMNGEMDFAAALAARVALFTGRPTTLLENAARRITVMPGARTLVTTMKAHGAQAWLITGGFLYFAGPVAAKLGFDKVYANDLGIAGGFMTGETGMPVLDRMRKKVLLEQACSELGLMLADTVSVGDGANDIPMLNTSNYGGGLGIAYHAKPNVRAEVANQISHTDLTGLLYAQGYKREEWVE